VVASDNQVQQFIRAVIRIKWRIAANRRVFLPRSKQTALPDRKPISARPLIASAKGSTLKKELSVLQSHLFDKVQPHVFDLNIVPTYIEVESEMAKHNNNF
jgi:hypothetical protein